MCVHVNYHNYILINYYIQPGTKQVLHKQSSFLSARLNKNICFKEMIVCVNETNKYSVCLSKSMSLKKPVQAYICSWFDILNHHLLGAKEAGRHN